MGMDGCESGKADKGMLKVGTHSVYGVLASAIKSIVCGCGI